MGAGTGPQPIQFDIGKVIQPARMIKHQREVIYSISVNSYIAKTLGRSCISQTFVMKHQQNVGWAALHAMNGLRKCGRDIKHLACAGNRSPRALDTPVDMG
jgi:hypothetical protein